MIDLTQERLKHFLSYDPDTGEFVRINAHKCVARFIGKRVGRVSRSGYVQIFVDGKYYQAHRLAWLYVVGRWPKEDIDHIDRCKTNNKFSNLREATNSENLQNNAKALRSNKSTGLLGVTFHKKTGKYQSMIMIGKKQKYLGLFASKEDAAKAYQAAKIWLHPFAPPLQELQSVSNRTAMAALL